MRFLCAFSFAAALFTVSSTAHADFFDVVKTVGQVAQATQAASEGRLELPTDAMKGGGKHGGSHGGGSHGGKHKK